MAKLACVAMTLSVCGAVVPVAAQAMASSYHVEIPREALDGALKDLAQQTGMQIARFSDSPSGSALVGPLSGEMSLDQALQSLLASNGLTYRVVNDHTIAVMSVNSAPAATSASGVTTAPATAVPGEQPSPASAGQDQKEGKTGSSAGFRLAQVGRGAAAGSAAVSSAAQLEEVVVTAQKRQERLIDAPQSVSVLSAETLTQLGALQFSDYANTIPGLGFTTFGAGYTQISMRGVTTGEETNPSVGIYVDDVPYGSSTAFAFGGQYALDLNLLDVDRIEVLRGPQGTLYGASTMGGLIKYVTKAPNTNSWGGELRTGVADTQHGGINYDVAAAANLPLLAGVAGMRVSAFYSRDGGYIDNVALGENNANRSNVHGGRLDFLLAPADRLSIRLAAVLQNISRGGQASADYNMSGSPAYGDLRQYRLYSEPFEQQFQLFSVRVNYDFGKAALTSISSYQAIHTQVFYDFSAEFLPIFDSPPPDGLGLSYSAVGFPDEDSTSKFTQEVRLASAGGGALEWLIGGFYTHEASVDWEAFAVRDLAGQTAPNDLLTYALPTNYREIAAFGDLTYHITSAFDVSGGIRYARNRQEANETASGLLGSSYPAPIRSNQSVTTYLANGRYHMGDHSTAYVRFATGYRPGGPNPIVFNAATGSLEVPATFLPDRLKSYEIGYNAETADRRFSLEANTYYIDWRDLQVITSTSNGFGAYTNASAATVHGVELTLSARPMPGFTATGSFAYQDPHLTRDAPLIGGVSGERLPNSAHLTGAINADYIFADVGLRPTVGATLRYVGNRTASFNDSATAPQYLLPPYKTLDLRAGLSLHPVDIQLFVHNVSDERGQLSAFTGRGPFAQVTILQPRTIGLSASMHF